MRNPVQPAPEASGVSPAALVLDAHSRAAVAAVQALGRAGIAVDAAGETASALARGSAYVRESLDCPAAASSEAFLEWLRRRDAGDRYRLIVPATEASLLALAALPEASALRAKAVLPGQAALNVALNKQATWDLALRCGVPVPAGHCIRKEDEIGPAPPFPVVLKPVHSKVWVEGRLVTLEPAIVRDETARRRQLLAWLPSTAVQQQEYVRGWGVGIEMLYRGGELCWHFAHERLHEWPLTGGASTYRRAIEAPGELLAYARWMLDALEWHGVAMVEFKRTPANRFVLMEINPRLWGSLALSVHAGVDFPLGLWKLAGGEFPGPQPAYRVGHTTRHVPADLRWMKTNLAASRANPLLLTRPRALSALEWLRPLTGRETWDHFDRNDLGIAARLLLGRLWSGRASNRRLRVMHRRTLALEPEIRNILFLCYGNICRSPLAHRLAERRLPGIQVESSGFHPKTGRPSPPEVAAEAALRGIDLEGWSSSRATAEQLERADLIVLMDAKNRDLLAGQFPGALERAAMLGMFGSRRWVEIEDPYGRDGAALRRCAQQIDRSVEGIARWIEKRRRSGAGKLEGLDRRTAG